MKRFYNIEDAANYLGLTPQTLRNWDKSGKINCIREAGSNYRLFPVEELDSIRSTVKPKIVRHSSKLTQREAFEFKSDADLKRLISKLHRIVRDFDGRSSIIERFDELTKLVFLHVNSNGSLNPIFQDVDSFGELVRKSYTELLSQMKFELPERFKKIHLDNQCVFSVFDCLSKFNTDDIYGSLKGLIYEEMIKDIFEKGENQQFFTPKTVVDFMAGLISSLTSGSICDPASGTGGFLINLAKNNSQFNKFTALEIDERLSWISGMNLEFHGCSDYEAVCIGNGGSLGTEVDGYRASFDAIITNPPFGSDYSDPKGLRHFKLGIGKNSRRRGVLFIERCLEFLKDGGYLAIIIDNGVLNHASNEDVRRLLLENSELLTVVSLPITTFMPYASVEASVLVLRKSKKPDRKTKTFFALAENVGKKNNGDEDYIYAPDGHKTLNNDLVNILAQWDQHINGEKIENSDSCYLSNIFSTFRSDEAHSSRIDFAFHHYSREFVRNALEKHSNKLIRLTDICREVNEPLVPAKDLPDQTILYTGLANIESNSEVYNQSSVPTNSIKSTVKRYQGGDVLFSKMRPNLRKCITVNPKHNGYCSSECIVFRPRDGLIDSRLLSAILRSDFVYGQIVHLITGIGRPRVSVKDLRTIMIPIPFDGKEAVSLKNYMKNMKKVNSLKMKSKEMLRQSIDLQNKSTNDLVNELLN